MFKKIVVPALEKYKAKRKYPDVPVLVHICGNAGSRVEAIRDFGAKFFSVDSMVDLKDMVEKCDGKMVMVGNINPAEVMLQGTPEQVYERSLEILELGGTIPCTGCRYCVEENHCPMEIKIPALFRAYNSMVLFGKVDPWEAYEKVIGDGSGKPGDCIECGMCEEVCPQHLEIRDLLKKVAEMFEA